jgi:tRNA(Arg) A34 adenosine deaminase TadA
VKSVKNSNYSVAIAQIIRVLLEHSSQNGEVPSYSILLSKENHFLTDSYNSIETIGATELHSEMVAIRSAQAMLKSRYLNGCTLVTSMEPCLMCAGAIIHARLERVIYLSENRPGEGISSLSPEVIYTKNCFPILTYHKNSEVTTKIKKFFQSIRNF